MRKIIIDRLASILENNEVGIPRYFECGDELMVHTAEELDTMCDEELIECFEATVGFAG
jgi:hypothetical protein